MEEHGNFYFSLRSLQLIQKSMWNAILFVAICAMNYSYFCCGSVLLVDTFLCIIFFLILSPSACFNKTLQNWALLLHLKWNVHFFWYICLFISTILIILSLYCFKNVLCNVLQRIFGDLKALSHWYKTRVPRCKAELVFCTVHRKHSQWLYFGYFVLYAGIDRKHYWIRNGVICIFRERNKLRWPFHFEDVWKSACIVIQQEWFKHMTGARDSREQTVCRPERLSVSLECWKCFIQLFSSGRCCLIEPKRVSASRMNHQRKSVS